MTKPMLSDYQTKKKNYKLVPYEVDESDLSALHVAKQLGEPVERVYKTLVLKGDENSYMSALSRAQKNWTPSWQPEYPAIKAVK